MKVGYIRVSTEEQNTIRQEILMKDLGVERVYMDKASGKSRTGRPQLEAMMDLWITGMMRSCLKPYLMRTGCRF